ncbi:MAG TPA: IS1595 family transposase [Pyrinomonadaceae bacterium]|nr:IS1595 family transposase [Pyrinomonadaceae bacterium]
MANGNAPKTLQQAIIYFSDPKNYLDYLAARRWPDGVTCPTCGRKDVTFLEKQNKWQCKSAHKQRQFSAKVGTIFEDSPLGLDKWLAAVWMIVNCKNGISSYEISRALGVTQKTAWFMDHRIRLAMQSGSFMKQMSGHIEVDETFIGGKARNMHRSVKARRLQGATGYEGKMAVMGLLERHGEVRTVIIPNTKRKSLRPAINAHVEPGSIVYSDALRSYNDLNTDYIHNVIDHAEKYVDGHIHTNGIENFWSLLKRCINGTYVSVEPFHLFRYLDEQTFRFNARFANDRERFEKVTERLAGKRLTYKELTGKLSDEDKLSC